MKRSGAQRPTHVDAILVTHEHSDHSSGLAQLARDWDCPAYLTEPTHREILKCFPKARCRRWSAWSTSARAESFEIGDIEVTPSPFRTMPPIRWATPFGAMARKSAIVTDLGYLPELVKHHLREADFLILESNHDLEMLKVGSVSLVHQAARDEPHRASFERVVSEFLADSEVSTAAPAHLVLAHLSEQNNNPDVARISAEEALGRRPANFAFRGSCTSPRSAFRSALRAVESANVSASESSTVRLKRIHQPFALMIAGPELRWTP